jgi:DNA-binding response OmpR family regulator
MADRKTILFIDDNPTDRTLISRLLAKYEFDVVLAEDGPKALLITQERKFDLILLDILLPHISGIELCKKFKRNLTTQNTPIIFYTSIDTPKHLIDYISYGAKDYVQKTMPPEELVSAIRAALA